MAMKHKFKTGQTVTYRQGGAGPGGVGRFEIVRLLPEVNGINHYRIKSLLDQHERVASEGELS